MNKTMEFTRIWYTGERKLARAKTFFEMALSVANTPYKVNLVSKAYTKRVQDIENERLEALKGLRA